MRRRRITQLAFLAMVAATAAGAQQAPQQPVRRYRVVGLFDARTGEAVDGAEITDLLSGLSATTRKTGTIELPLGEGTGFLLRIRKLGYEPLVQAVPTGLRDTIPVTLVLNATQVLPATITRARSSTRAAGDTVRRLELNGFYDRRQTTGAPSSSFLTEEQIGKLSRVSDAAVLSGRNVCSTNLYLNGVRVADVAGSVRRSRSRPASGPRSLPIDQLVSPSEVLAMEFYRTADAPPEYNATRPPDVADCGVTLVWTK